MLSIHTAVVGWSASMRAAGSSLPAPAPVDIRGRPARAGRRVLRLAPRGRARLLGAAAVGRAGRVDVLLGRLARAAVGAVYGFVLEKAAEIAWCDPEKEQAIGRSKH